MAACLQLEILPRVAGKQSGEQALFAAIKIMEAEVRRGGSK